MGRLCNTNKAARNQLPKDVRDDDRFYPTKKEQNRLEVYKFGDKTLGDYNESF